MTWAAAVAAVVSIVAAVMAFLSARKAEEEARSITTLNHKVAALDRQAGQLREDYRGLMKALGDIQGARDVGSIMAAGELLGAHPRASEPLSVAIRELIGKMAQSFVTGETEGMNVVIASIRDGFRESLAEIERMRSGLLG
jgi:outer membrane murein-binding lipoprotein Lpp